jgi:hypothetical protein
MTGPILRLSISHHFEPDSHDPPPYGRAIGRGQRLASSVATPRHTFVKQQRRLCRFVATAERSRAKDTLVAMWNRSANWRKLAEDAEAMAARMQDAVSKETML